MRELFLQQQQPVTAAGIASCWTAALQQDDHESQKTKDSWVSWLSSKHGRYFGLLLKASSSHAFTLMNEHVHTIMQPGVPHLVHVVHAITIHTSDMETRLCSSSPLPVVR